MITKDVKLKLGVGELVKYGVPKNHIAISMDPLGIIITAEILIMMNIHFGAILQIPKRDGTTATQLVRPCASKRNRSLLLLKAQSCSECVAFE